MEFHGVVYDVIVAGAGPVGLLYAAELSKEFRVAVIDKGPIPTYVKSWGVYRWALKQTGYERFGSNILRAFGIHSHLAQQSVVIELKPEQEWITIDEYQWLPHLIDLIRRNGGDILERVSIAETTVGERAIELHTTQGPIRAKLMLDCTGVNSPFIPKEDNLLIEYYWNIYGRRFTGGNVDFSVSHILAHIGDKDGYKLFVNDVPEGSSHYTPWLYIMSRQKIPVDQMREYYEFAVNSDFLKNRVANFSPTAEKYGSAPMRDFKQRATDRILSLGDAGGMGPWASGATVGFSLETLPVFLPRIRKALNENRLTAADLEQVLALPPSYLLLLDIGKIFFIFTMNTTASQFAKLVSAVAEINNRQDIYLNMIFHDFREFLKLIRILLSYFKLPELFNILVKNGWHDIAVISRQMVKHVVRQRM